MNTLVIYTKNLYILYYLLDHREYRERVAKLYFLHYSFILVFVIALLLKRLALSATHFPNIFILLTFETTDIF